LKVLIIGSEGFVGYNLVDGLSEKFQILTSDITEKNRLDNYTQCDITNYDEVINTVKDVDVVINLATHSLVSSLGEETKNAQVNIIGLLNILCACRENNIKKIIFTSASSLIGEPESLKVSENHPTKPKTAYGITKLASEHYLRLFQELYKINFVIFRFFNIYGPYQKNGLIPSLYKKISSNESVTIFGDGKQLRDFVYIRDILPFFEKAISNDFANNSIYNIGTGTGTTISDVIVQMSEILHTKPKIQRESVRKGEIGNFIADTRKLEKIFGQKPDTSIKDGLDQTISWLTNQ
tara:strand:- start:1666 stop:2547 length:882 start_codon:yes stop_codon:yes gene_type:complete